MSRSVLPKTPPVEVERYENAVAVDGEVFGYYTSEKGMYRVIARARKAHPDAKDIRCIERSVIRTDWRDAS